MGLVPAEGRESDARGDTGVAVGHGRGSVCAFLVRGVSCGARAALFPALNPARDRESGPRGPARRPPALATARNGGPGLEVRRGRRRRPAPCTEIRAPSARVPRVLTHTRVRARRSGKVRATCGPRCRAGRLRARSRTRPSERTRKNGGCLKRRALAALCARARFGEVDVQPRRWGLHHEFVVSTSGGRPGDG